MHKKLSQFSPSLKSNQHRYCKATQPERNPWISVARLRCFHYRVGSPLDLFFFMPRHKAGGHCPLRIRVGLFIPLSVYFSLYMIIQFHVRERGIMQLLPKEDYLGHDIVGLNPPPQPQSVRENTSERGISEKTRIMQKRQKGLMKQLHRIIDERGEKLPPKPSGWHKYGYNRIQNHFNCDGLDADASSLLRHAWRERSWSLRIKRY